MDKRSEQALREQIIDVGRRLYDKNVVAANDGNITVRLDDNRFLATPTGRSKGFMHAEELLIVDAAGKPLSGGKPSTELPMHLFIYDQRPDVNAVVHAHPPYATGFATAGLALDKCVLAEIIVTIGSIPLAEYGTPSTNELPDSLRPYIQTHDAFLLANHGVVTVGHNLMDAYYKLERVEHSAKIIYIARTLGGEKTLPENQVKKLYDIRKTYGGETLNPGCYACRDDCIGESCLNHAVMYDPDAPDFFNQLVEKVLTEVRPLFQDQKQDKAAR